MSRGFACLAFLLIFACNLACSDKKEPQPGQDTQAQSAAKKKPEKKPPAPARDKPATPAEPQEKFEALDTAMDSLPALEAKLNPGKQGKWARVMKPRKAPKYGFVGFSKLLFVDDQHGWAMGNYATLIHTTNGGKKWKELRSSPRDMRTVHPDVFFRSPTTGFTTDGRSFMTTSDGGKTWTEFGKANLPLGSVHFVDDNTVWSVERERAWRSQDGGKSWKISLMPSYTFFSHVHFTSPERGWLLGMRSNRLNVWRTSNNGDKWIRVMGLDKDSRRRDPRDLSLVGTDTVWIAGENNLLVKTSDAGKTWQQVKGLAQDAATYQAVHFMDESTGWLLVYEHKSPTSSLLHTADGGKTWTAQNIKTKKKEVLNGLYHDGKSLWALGDGIYRMK